MRLLRRGIRVLGLVFGGITGFLLAAVVAGLLNEELGLWAAIAWIVLVVGAVATNFALRSWGR